MESKGAKAMYKVKTAMTPESAAREVLAATNVPMWSGTFTVAATTYPYTIVGTNPSGLDTYTKIPTLLIPLEFDFAPGVYLSASHADQCGMSSTLSPIQLVYYSPVVQALPFTSNGVNVGTAQYNDAFQRAEFWTSASSKPNWHTHMLISGFQPTQVINASTTTGTGQKGVYECSPGVYHLYGSMDYTDFDTQLQAIITKMGIPKTTFPIFIGYNTWLYDGNPGNCCILGYHGATAGGQTYAFASYDDAGFFMNSQDVSPLTHEVGEWLNDPFGTNPTPPWGHIGQVSGCQNNLEVGDPLSGTVFTATSHSLTYSLQELAYFSWFAHDSTSKGTGGKYSFNGTFTSFAAACS